MLLAQGRPIGEPPLGPQSDGQRPMEVRAGEPGVGRVLVVEADPLVLKSLVEALPARLALHTFSSLDQADGTQLAPDLGLAIVLGPSQATATTLLRLGDLLRATPSAGAVLVLAEPSTELVRLALRAGAADAVDIRETGAELAPAVDRLLARLDDELRRRRAAPAAAGAAPRKGHVTSVFSPKGGVGKSVVAVNLAASLGKTTGQPVVVMDLDLQFGDIAVMLRLQPVHTFTDAVSAGDLLDHDLLRSFLVRHDKSGVYVLAAPTSPSEADQVGPGPMLRVLELLQDMFAHVVVDTPPHLSEVVLQAVALSDTICFVVGMDVPSVKNASLGLQAFELLQLPLDKVLLVLNRADSRVHIDERDIESALEIGIDLTFPSEVAVPQSVNQGNPVVLEYPRSRFSAQIEQLAGLVLARDAELSAAEPVARP
jgi:pilus assembly protein CpaE